MLERDDSEARLSARLEREAFRLAAIVESAEDAIVSKDLDGIIQSWNHGAERIFGYTAEEAIGRPITIVIPDDRLDEEAEVLRRIRAGIAVDASRLKDEFLALLSHELRTPLNTVLGYARMLRREDSRMAGELRMRSLDALERNADALSRLVTDVLDTSRSVSGKLRLDLETAPLEEIVSEAVRTVSPPAEAKDLSFEIHCEPGISVRADRDRLQQVLWNLLSNAIKFTPAGGTVSLRTRRDHGSIVISVEDSGIGIAPEHLPHVFQRF